MTDTLPGATTILMIHGHAIKPPQDVLQEINVAAMRWGFARDYPDEQPRLDSTHFESVYYGDLTNKVLLTAGRCFDEKLDIADRRNALQDLKAVPNRKRFGFRQYDALPGKTAVPELLANIGAPVFGALGLTMPILKKLAPEFVAYLRNEAGIGSEIRRRARDAIIDAMDKQQNLMIITHGMGSAVAYDSLWQLSHDSRFSQYADNKIDCLVTMGSPLGDNKLRKRLLGADQSGSACYPSNIISWHNMSAEDDYVCHDSTVADDFSKMIRRRLVSKVKDYRIYNLAVRYARSNPHSSVGYYIHPRLAKIICDWIVLQG